MIETDVFKNLQSLRKKCRSLPTRGDLKEHEERIMLICGELTDQTRGAGQYRLLTDVSFRKIIFRSFGKKYFTRKCQKTTDHIWVEESIVRHKMCVMRKEKKLVSCGIVKEYTRKNGSIDYGVVPLPSSQLILGRVEFSLYNLARLDANFNTVMYNHPESLKEEIARGLELVNIILNDESSYAKMIRAIVNQEKIVGILTLCYSFSCKIYNYEEIKLRRSKKKAKPKKGFGK